MMLRTPFLFLVAIAACRRAAVPVPPPATPAPAPAVTPAAISEWPVTLINAAKAAQGGDYETADRLLITHGLEFPNSPEANEAALWRAILAADPVNRRFQYSERLGLIDAAIAAGARGPRGVEATILRRLVEAADSMAAIVTIMRTNSDQRLRARDEELRRLADELDRTTAELERIKKRLGPRPPTERE